MYIDFLATGQRLTVTDQFRSTTANYGVEQIKFADGVIWDRAQISTAALFRGTSGADTITGNASATGYDMGAGNDAITDTLGGGDWYYWGAGDGGADTLRGLYGDDRYLFGRGSGADMIDENGLPTHFDTVVSGPVIRASDVLLSRSVASESIR